MNEERSLELAWIEDDEGQTMPISDPDGTLRSYQQVMELPIVRALLKHLGWVDFTWSVFGKPRQLSDLVRPGDRIELLPGLRFNPNIARQRRAAHKLRTRRGR
jgi:putative ubiquitin-RnfH superfamily antitoxin RatB of RatAB toxin-antitoxin module